VVGAERRAGAFGLLVAAALMLIFGGATAGRRDRRPQRGRGHPDPRSDRRRHLHLLLMLSLPGVVIGVGLLQRRPWRVAGIVISPQPVQLPVRDDARRLRALGVVCERHRAVFNAASTRRRYETPSLAPSIAAAHTLWMPPSLGQQSTITPTARS
jgi:hypothetical protein